MTLRWSISQEVVRSDRIFCSWCLYSDGWHTSDRALWPIWRLPAWGRYCWGNKPNFYCNLPQQICNRLRIIDFSQELFWSIWRIISIGTEFLHQDCPEVDCTIPWPWHRLLSNYWVENKSDWWSGPFRRNVHTISVGKDQPIPWLWVGGEKLTSSWCLWYVFCQPDSNLSTSKNYHHRSLFAAFIRHPGHVAELYDMFGGNPCSIRLEYGSFWQKEGVTLRAISCLNLG